MNVIEQLNNEQIQALGKNVPDFSPGDTLRVGYKVSEGSRSRVQNYEGVVISRKGGNEIAASFTVRKISFGEGVERSPDERMRACCCGGRITLGRYMQRGSACAQCTFGRRCRAAGCSVNWRPATGACHCTKVPIRQMGRGVPRAGAKSAHRNGRDTRQGIG